MDERRRGHMFINLVEFHLMKTEVAGDGGVTFRHFKISVKVA